MYAEFIIIYVLLGIIALMLVTAVVMLAMVLRKLANNGAVGARGNFSAASPNQNSDNGVAFCRRCAARFDANTRICPKCGTPR